MDGQQPDIKISAFEPDATAPDGSEVRVLLRLIGGSMAEFSLPPDQTSVPVRHLSVQELWYVVDGSGQMWRSAAGQTEAGTVVDLAPGTCVSIPLGTSFQFCSGERGLRVVGVTMPPWPLDRIEAVRAEGIWASTVEPGPGLGGG